MPSTPHVLVKTKTCANAQILYKLSSHYGGGGEGGGREAGEMSRSEKQGRWRNGKVGEVEGMSVGAKWESGGWW